MSLVVDFWGKGGREGTKLSPQINDFSWAMVRKKEVSWGFKNCPLLLFLPRCIYYGERRPLLAGWIGFQDGGMGWGVLGQWWDGDVGLLRWQFWQHSPFPLLFFSLFWLPFKSFPLLPLFFPFQIRSTAAAKKAATHRHSHHIQPRPAPASIFISFFPAKL